MKKTKQAWLIASSLAFVMALAVAVPIYAHAATTTTSSSNGTTITKTTRGRNLKNLTAAQLATLKQNMTAKRAAATAKQTAVNNALAANDYNAWVTAEGTNTALTSKINASNFSKLVDIYNLEKQIKQDQTDLGITNLSGHGFGAGFGGFVKATATTAVSQ